MANGYKPGDYFRQFLNQLPQIYSAKQNMDLQREKFQYMKEEGIKDDVYRGQVLTANQERNELAREQVEQRKTQNTQDEAYRTAVLDNATKTVTGLYTDKLQYDAQERMALAISGQTGVYQREQNKLAYSQQLMSQGIMPGTQQYNDAMEAYQKGQPKIQGKRYGGYRRRY